jgi:hypothetical protein
MSTPITYDAMLGALERAIEQRGADYIHAADCVYVDREDRPVCGVGVALLDLGYLDTVKFLVLAHQMDGGLLIPDVADRNYQPRASALLDAMDDSGIEVDPRARDLAQAFQIWQDEGRSWGDALEHARFTTPTDPFARREEHAS